MIARITTALGGLFHQLNESLPLRDKVLIPIGAAVSTASTTVNVWSSAGTIIGVLVGALTCLALIPRVIIAWRKLLRGDDENDK